MPTARVSARIVLRGAERYGTGDAHLMISRQESDRAASAANDQVLRPAQWRPRDRHVLLGVSHPSDDPSRHRVFEVRATFDAAIGGWVAQVGEQNLNEQRGEWGQRLTTQGRARAFPTAAACLGDAVAIVVATVDRDAESGS